MLLIYSFIMFITISLLNAAPNDFATVEIEHGSQIVQSGDYIDVKGSNFVPNDQVRFVFMTMLDESNRIVGNVVLEEYDLQIDESGILRGRVKVGKIYTAASKFHLLIFTENTNVRNSNFLISIGSDSEPPPVVEDVGTAALSDPTAVGGNNNGTAENDENLWVYGTGWASSELNTIIQVQYSDLAGTVWNGQQSFPYIDGGISSGTLDATVTTTSSYLSGTQSIRAQVVTTIFEVAFSNVMPTPDIIPPNLTSAYAYDLNTIRLIFDEPVYEDGNAHERFTITGASVTPSDLTNVGSVPTDTWDLSLSTPFTDRGLATGSVYIDYEQSGGGNNLYDEADLEVSTTTSSITVDDSIPPDVTTLTKSDYTVELSVGEFLGNDQYLLYARVTNGNDDSSLDGVSFEGWLNETSGWTSIDIDGEPTISGNHADFSVTWYIQTDGQFRRLRARAFDDAGAGGNNDVLDADDNVTVSTVVGSTTDGINDNFMDSYWVIITSVDPDPITASTGSDRSQITLQMQNNYGDEINTTNMNLTFVFKELAADNTTTDLWWNHPTNDDPPGGSEDQIEFALDKEYSQGNVYYSNSVAGGPIELDLTEKTPGANFIPGGGIVSGNEQTITITTGDASKIWIRFEGQSFVNGTGVTGTPIDQVASDTITARLYVTDNANNLITDFTYPRTVDFSTTASNAPDGSPPSVSGSTGLTGISVDFSGGTDTVTVRFPNVESGVTLTASSSPDLTGVESSGVTIVPGPLDQFEFLMDSPQKDNEAVEGTNTLTAWDTYQNVITNYDASTNNVTITGAGPGTATITGLGSGNNNVLNQSGDFVSGVADLTTLGMIIDVTAIGTYNFTATSSDVKTGVASGININSVRTVSNPTSGTGNNPSEYVIVDATTNNSDLPVAANISGTVQGFDDIRVLWGFNDNDEIGNYDVQDQSGTLTPGGSPLKITYTIPAVDIRNGDGYEYFHWWIENISTDENATIIEGNPISTDPQQLVVNPHLITLGGVNGGDVVQWPFTPGVNNQEILSVRFQSDATEASIDITSLTFIKSGTTVGDDISAFHLYSDVNINGEYDSGTDVLLNTFSPYDGQTTIGFNPISDFTVIGLTNYVLVTVDIAAGADPYNTLGLALQNTSAIVVDGIVLNTTGQAGNAIIKDGFSPISTGTDYSCPVTISSCQAKAGYGKIILSWTTASEENNAGFYVMRAEEENGQYIRLNDVIIEGHGNTTVEHHYRYEDTNVEIGKIYYYKLYSVDYNGDLFQYLFAESAVAMALPETFALKQNFPNPFNPTTRISFAVPQESQVKLEIYNMLGQKVRTLLDDRMEPGVYENVIWDAKDDEGNTLGNGIYYLVMISSDQGFKQVKKMVFMK